MDLQISPELQLNDFELLLTAPRHDVEQDL